MKILIVYLILLTSLSACSSHEKTISNIYVFEVTTPELENFPSYETEFNNLILVERENYINLEDVITGDIKYSINLDNKLVHQTWAIDNEYYLLFLGHFNPRNFYASFSNFNLLLLDNKLNIIDEFEFDYLQFLNLNDVIFQIQDNEIYLIGKEFDNNHDNQYSQLIRYNIKTQEITNLVKINRSYSLHTQVSEDLLFITNQNTDWARGRVDLIYGVLNIRTGNIYNFERKGFGKSHRVEVFDNTVLIPEGRSTTEINNEIILFNFDTMMSSFISMPDDESGNARFSFDGHYIVTVNQSLNLFRKYNFDGEIVFEKSLFIPEQPRNLTNLSEIEIEQSEIYYDFEIFAISEYKYSIHIRIFLLNNLFFVQDNVIEIIMVNKE